MQMYLRSRSVSLKSSSDGMDQKIGSNFQHNRGSFEGSPLDEMGRSNELMLLWGKAYSNEVRTK